METRFLRVIIGQNYGMLSRNNRRCILGVLRKEQHLDKKPMSIPGREYTVIPVAAVI